MLSYQELQESILRVEEKLNSMVFVGGNVEQTPTSLQLLADDSEGYSYLGAFTVVKKNNTTITVKAYDGSTYFTHNYCIMGLDRIEQDSDTDVTITVTGIVYGKIVYSAPNYVLTFVNAAILPDQIVGEEYFTICDVVFADKAITKINQVIRGQYHSQRIV